MGQICDYLGRGGSRTAPQVSWIFSEEDVDVPDGIAVTTMKRNERKEGGVLTTHSSTTRQIGKRVLSLKPNEAAASTIAGMSGSIQIRAVGGGWYDGGLYAVPDASSYEFSRFAEVFAPPDVCSFSAYAATASDMSGFGRR
ncbi:hypothetical protein LTS10_009385 [Elasticomyces elasticus]|nr:hypothetical protein LTS10_009385 [Elasticomyces elasticus]